MIKIISGTTLQGLDIIAGRHIDFLWTILLISLILMVAIVIATVVTLHKRKNRQELTNSKVKNNIEDNIDI